MVPQHLTQYPCGSSEPLCKSAGSDLEHSVRCLTEAVKGLQQQDLSCRLDLSKLLIKAQEELGRLSAECSEASTAASSGRSSTCASTLESVSTRPTFPCYSSAMSPTADFDIRTAPTSPCPTSRELSVSTRPTIPCYSSAMSPTPDFDIRTAPTSPCPTSRELPHHFVDYAIPDSPLPSLPCLSSSLLPDSQSKPSRPRARARTKTVPQFPMLAANSFRRAEPVQEEDVSCDAWEVQFLSAS